MARRFCCLNIDTFLALQQQQPLHQLLKNSILSLAIIAKAVLGDPLPFALQKYLDENYMSVGIIPSSRPFTCLVATPHLTQWHNMH